MSRTSKGARLYLRPARRDKNGKIREKATWIIRDGEKYISTGCARPEIDEAEEKLRRYLAEKYEPNRVERDIEAISIADVLSIFIDDCRDSQKNKRTFDGRMDRLNRWWGSKTLAEINGRTCRDFVKARKAKGGARRDLEDLRAAVNHHAKEGYHRGVVRVTLPAKGPPRERWLTRSEAARLIWACWRAREIQTRGRGKHKGKKLPTKKYPLRHLARFLLIGLYTGTRATSIAAAAPFRAIGRSYVDLERGVFYRLPEGETETNKRQPAVPVPPRLLAHMRRWKNKKLIARSFVEWNGNDVKSVKTAFKHAVRIAGLSGKVTAHTLRHTAATWLMQAGVDPWQAAGYLGMSVETLLRVYGHHHPDHLADAVEGITRKPKGERSKSVSVGISVGRKTVGRISP
ncbi:MAG: site-specific integrase [Proteobacteria bacterium]|nr:site-specific integrase [Pseudomonadota bacterium]